MRPKNNIQIVSIIGQIEGHYDAPPQTKTTKYEHVMPQLAAIEGLAAALIADISGEKQ